MTRFKPAGVPMRHLEEVILTDDESEVIDLIDYKGMDQQDAGRQMKISRITVQRIYKSARYKIAESLIEGKALRLHGAGVLNCGCRMCQNNLMKGGD